MSTESLYVRLHLPPFHHTISILPQGCTKPQMEILYDSHVLNLHPERASELVIVYSRI